MRVGCDVESLGLAGKRHPAFATCDVEMKPEFVVPSLVAWFEAKAGRA